MSEPIQSLLAEGAQARREGRSADARAAYAEAAALSRQAGDTALLVQSLKGFGQILRDEGETYDSLECYEEAAALSCKLDNPLAFAHTIRHVADIQRNLEKFEGGAANYAEALRIYRAHPERNTLDLANTLRGYALLQSSMGRKAEAIALWQEAGELYDQVWREPGTPYSQSDLAPGIEESERQIAMLSGS